jgi:hypothetical protein
MEKSVGMHYQHFRKYSSHSTFNQASQESEPEGRLTSYCRDEHYEKLEETDRHGPNKTAKYNEFNRINYLLAKGEGIEKHIPAKTMHAECMDKGKTDVHQQMLNEGSITGSEKAHAIMQDTHEYTKVRQSTTPDKMLAFSVGQEMTDKCTEDGMCSDKYGGSVVSENKRVTIHMYSQKNADLRFPAKLINLPGSMDELFTVASKYSSIHTNYTIITIHRRAHKSPKELQLPSSKYKRGWSLFEKPFQLLLF